MERERLFPAYSVIPLLLVLVVNCVGFFGMELISPLRDFRMIHTALDDRLPLVTGFVYVYVLAFVQWGVGYLIIARDSKERCYRVLSGELIAKILALLIILLVPITMERPSFTPTSPSGYLLALIYRLDKPVSLFPSLHCLESWQVFRCSVGLKKMGKWYPWFQFVFTLLVFVSVLLVKQHLWPDVVAGVLVAELGQWLGRKLRAERLFQGLERIKK